jgi:hypothetical protein
MFCYEFLHHFPSLAPIITEIYCVLSDGYFFFDEEPFKRVLKLSLVQTEDEDIFRKGAQENQIRQPD